MKKFISIFITLSICLSLLILSANAATTYKDFTYDLSQDHKKYGLRMSCIKAKSLASVICITRCLLDGGFLLPIQSYSRNSKTMGCHEHMEKTTVLMSLYVLTAEVHLFRKAKFSHGLTTKTEAVVAMVG